MVVQRRTFLALVGAGPLALVLAEPAHASVARAISVSDLVKRSRSVVLATPLSGHSEWATIGDSRRIITITRIRIEEHVGRNKPEASEVLVRTLGGRVGKLGQVVHGEAELRAERTSMLFLHDAEGGLSTVTAMAQGHYPLYTDAGKTTLQKSPGLAKLVMGADAAVERLTGIGLEAATKIVREADRP